MCGLLANVSHSLPQDLSGRFRATISGSSVSGFERAFLHSLGRLPPHAWTSAANSPFRPEGPD
jgi:hypothetical protein